MTKHVEIRQAGRTIAVAERAAILEAALADVVAMDLQEFGGRKTYVAWPPPMVEAAMLICRARRLRSADLHAEVFFTPAEVSARR